MPSCSSSSYFHQTSIYVEDSLGRKLRSDESSYWNYSSHQSLGPPPDPPITRIDLRLEMLIEPFLALDCFRLVCNGILVVEVGFDTLWTSDVVVAVGIVGVEGLERATRMKEMETGTGI